MKFKYTILYVEDVASTLDFFKRAFGFDQQFLHESGDYGELNTGNTTLSFSSLKLMQDLGKSPSRAKANAPIFEIAFESNDVRADLSSALAAGAALQQDIREESWGQTTAYVTDPNGFLIEICSPVAT
ncbi:VOC family protein [Acaryochloris sp. IP29b_bin.148]|uniref:VOC family protein n=1 Tax=Acaryochloris sp. IP29b_bin.148 TaxID=2969218 RepID=UPI0026174B47|nr:VOC family protein [Acaryochloris sp. IP29b_bin.148]